MKKMMILVMIVVLVGGVFGQAILYLENPNSEIKTGDEFYINVNVSAVVDLYGVQLDFKFCPDILGHIDIDEGDFLNSDGVGTFTWPPDTSISDLLQNYVISRTGNVTGLNGSGNIARIKFKALSGGSCDLGLLNTKLVSSTPTADLIPHFVQNSSVYVVSTLGFSISPSILNYSKLDPGQNSSVEVITFESTGDAIEISVDVDNGLFENIWFDLGEGYNPLGVDEIILGAGEVKDVNSILSVPIGYKSGDYKGIVTYTAMVPI